MARKNSRPVDPDATPPDPGQVPSPDPARVEAVIEVLREFIAATAWRPGQPEPREDIARDAGDRLEFAITELGDFERWEDEPGRLTGAGLVAFYVRDIRSIRAGMSADTRSALYASPREQRWLNGDLDGLREGLAAIQRLGAFGSMNPMDNPDPVRRPDVVHLTSLLQAAGHWLEISRIHEGQEPVDDFRFHIRDACGLLCMFLDQVGFDQRWINIPRFQRLFHALDTTRKALQEVMERACFVWRDGMIEFDPPPYSIGTDGCIQSRPCPAYIDPERAKDVECAVADLRRIVDRFRTEGVPRSPEEIELPSPAVIQTAATQQPPLIPPQAVAVITKDAMTEERDKYIYDQCVLGTPYQSIANRVKEKTAWTPIDSVQGIREAARRFAERRRLPQPAPRNAGRRAKE